MKKYGWLLWTALPLILFAGILWLTRPQSDPTHPGMNFVGNERIAPVPTQVEVADLQRRADAACLCGRARSRPSDQQCWADYRRQATRFEPFEMVSACGEESATVDCFGADGPNQRCVTTQRAYGACSDGETQVRLAEARRRGSRSC